MPKGAYKPGRDRRQIEGSGAGSRVVFLWLPRLGEVDTENFVINFDCVLWQPEEQVLGEIAVWEYFPDLNAVGITATDQTGVVDIDIEILSQNEFQISAAAFIGLTSITIPAQIRQMTAPRNIQCAGGTYTAWFPPNCDPNVTTYDMQLDAFGVITNHVMTGSLNDGLFVSESGWILRWFNEQNGWALYEELGGAKSLTTGTRCDAVGIYNWEPGYSAAVTLPI